MTNIEIQLLKYISINNQKLEIYDIFYKIIEHNTPFIKIKNDNKINFMEIDEKLYENASEIY